MGEELKACPFCGAHKQPEGIGLRWEEEPDDLFYVACERCGGRTMGGDTEAEAITAWNTRARSLKAMRPTFLLPPSPSSKDRPDD